MSWLARKGRNPAANGSALLADGSGALPRNGTVQCDTNLPSHVNFRFGRNTAVIASKASDKQGSQDGYHRRLPLGRQPAGCGSYIRPLRTLSRITQSWPHHPRRRSEVRGSSSVQQRGLKPPVLQFRRNSPLTASCRCSQNSLISCTECRMSPRKNSASFCWIDSLGFTLVYRILAQAVRLAVAAAVLVGAVADAPVFAQTKAATVTSISVKANGSAATSVPAGTVITLTAQVTSGGAAVNKGQVNFCDATAAHCTDIHILATAQLTSSGTATYRFRPGIGSPQL